MAKKSAAAVRKQMVQAVEEAVQQTRVNVERIKQQAQAAQVQPARQLLITVSLDGAQVDVANKPLVTGEQLSRAGNALRGLCYNIMNGVLSPEVRDTSAECWKGISNTDKSAFRFLRGILDGSESLPQPLRDQVKGLNTEQRAALIRNRWAAYVADIAKQKEEAKATGKRSNVRVRDVTLQALKKLFKGAAPKGGGVTGLKEGILKEVQGLQKAMKAKSWDGVKKHVDAILAMVEPKQEEPEGEKA